MKSLLFLAAKYKETMGVYLTINVYWLTLESINIIVGVARI